MSDAINKFINIQDKDTIQNNLYSLELYTDWQNYIRWFFRNGSWKFDIFLKNLYCCNFISTVWSNFTGQKNSGYLTVECTDSVKWPKFMHFNFWIRNN